MRTEDPILAIDFETTGLDPLRHQGIQVGVAVLSGDLKHVLAQACISTRFEADRFEYDPEAAIVNGQKPEDIKHRLSLKDGARALVSFLRLHFDASSPIVIAAHNPSFDRGFIEQWFREAGTRVRLHYRQIDTYTLGRVLFQARNSDELFNMVGIERSNHDACQDVEGVIRVLQLASGAVDDPKDFPVLTMEPLVAP